VRLPPRPTLTRRCRPAPSGRCSIWCSTWVRASAGAAIVAASPAEAPPAKDAAEAPRELEALLAWYTGSNELLLSALREAGPEREC
jgi:hypothetical protein